jgi:hypothetical protein
MKRVFALSLVVFVCLSSGTGSYAQEQVQIKLSNKTGFDFVDIFFSPSGQNQWGPDMATGVFNNMEMHEIAITTEEKLCEYDLKAVRPDSTELLFEKLNLCMMPIITLLYEFDEPWFVQDFIIENETDLTFSELYVKEATSGIWGMNVLGQNVLTRREKAIISFKPGSGKTCLYDIKATLLNGRELLYKNINLCSQENVVLYRYQGKPYFSFD